MWKIYKRKSQLVFRNCYNWNSKINWNLGERVKKVTTRLKSYLNLVIRNLIKIIVIVVEITVI